MELWAGHECTLNRVGDVFRDQTRLSGHHDRIDDLDAFASLGLQRLRYPALWERIAPDAPGCCDWDWLDARLARLRQLGVQPILGLCHHGSGPAYVDLLDDGFAPGLAAHARAVAERYPWVEDWTPVNEPLTTARFSALYGHWYPHHRDERSFWRALFNQIDATRLAMKAIRSVNPAARLIQTEDLGRTSATQALEAQSVFDNRRRWMSWDLLFGRVDVAHPLWRHVCDLGFTDRLQRILDDPCPPDVIGVNHYVTSDRFLDHHLGPYPAHLWGGNDTVTYADIEAVRVVTPALGGFEQALREAWARYRAPLALTEVHIGCTLEEQMRWIREAWMAALTVRAEGAEVCAITPWALLGTFDWDNLLTAPNNHYEPGVFRIAADGVEPTILVRYIQGLARGASGLHPAAEGEGWWRREERLLYPPVHLQGCAATSCTDFAAPQAVAIAGSDHALGSPA